MTIERITLTHVRIPFVEPFRISNGEVREKDGIIIAIHADGLVGVGEASPMSGSFYSEETPESTWDVLNTTIIPAVLAGRPGTADDVHGILEKIGGNPFARAGVETAMWDLDAQRAGIPLFKLLGGKDKPVPSGLAVGIYDDVPALLDAIERNLAEGYVRVKIKIQPGWDCVPLKAVRNRFGDIPLMVDANCAYGRQDFKHLRLLDEFGLVMIEQPLSRRDLAGHATLQSMMRTPICLDESAEGITAVRQAIDLGSCRIINIKIQRVGGLKNAIAIHDICAKSDIPVWAGTMPELGIGSVQAVHLATMKNFTYPTDVESSRRWFADDIIQPLIEVAAGYIRIPAGTGICYHPDQGKIRSYTIRSHVW